MSQNNQNKFHWKKWHSAVVVLALLGAGGVYYANTATQRPSSAPSVTTQSKQAASPKMQKPKTKKSPKKAAPEKHDVVADAFKSIGDTVSSGAKQAENIVGDIVGNNPLAKAVADLTSSKNTDKLADAAKTISAAANPQMGHVVDLAQGTDTPAKVKPIDNSSVDNGGKKPVDDQQSGSGTTGGTIVAPDKPSGNGGQEQSGGGNSGSGNQGGTSGDSGSGSTGTDTKPQNTAPIFSIVDGAVQVSLRGKQPDLLAGVTAKDKQDGDLTHAIKASGTVDVTKAGSYTISYFVEDSEGLNATALRTFEVKNDAPVIHAPESIQLLVGSNFAPFDQVSADDVQDGNLTGKLIYEGSVITAMPNASTVTYTVTDADGATTTKQVKVIVVAADATFTGIENVTIKVGEAFDKMKGVSVKDPYTPNDKSFDVIGDVDNQEAGTYELSYSHKDKFDHVTTAKRTVTVQPKATTPDPQPSTDQPSTDQTKPDDPSESKPNAGSTDSTTGESQPTTPSNETSSTGVSQTPAVGSSVEGSSKVETSNSNVAQPQESKSSQVATANQDTEKVNASDPKN